MTLSTSKRRGADHKSEGRGVQSIELGSRLLQALCQEAEPMMLKDLAKVAGFAPAQAHAYLVSYKKIGFIEQHPETGLYSLGPFAVDLGLTAMRTTDPMELAHDAVQELSADTSLNVALVAWGSFGPTVVQVQESGSQINMNTRPGTVYSMSGTASGLVFSAFLSEKEVKDFVAREKRDPAGSGRVGVSRFVPRREIDQIREQGYATVESPPVPGIHAYSAPVFDHTGQVVLAITIIGQDHYIEPRAQSEFIPALLEATRTLSVNLGHRITA
ncbi:IclR family transcriptional regulator [Celeribacter litoreus]|uniref:IclR family transcriptional regulator n=1 Tax=Celeribacter litoreus TaxID=2876714 RepID=UPI001CCC3B98|nr:IclR family transcriptional regulator [Celeribacter litoreus]MCA0043521.1 IclR family transcriptional regulator [Celeribacter litoreus]